LLNGEENELLTLNQKSRDNRDEKDDEYGNDEFHIDPDELK